MFFSIIPFSHSIGTQPLLYLGGTIDERQVQIGQIVEIPYGNNMENGIVAGIYQESPIDTQSEMYARIKPIHRIITQCVLLAPYQIEMIMRISALYMIPIHRVLAIFLTRPILSRLEKKNFEAIQETKKIAKSTGHGRIHIVQDTIVTPDIVESHIDGPTVVILPDDYAMMPYREKYAPQKDILFVSNDMTDIRRAQAWIDIANGVIPIIYGTRKILYYNLAAYSNILYIEDALGPDYWHYPIRIHYSDIIYIFSQVHPETNLTILTSIPTLTTLTHFRHFELANIQSNTLKTQASGQKI